MVDQSRGTPRWRAGYSKDYILRIEATSLAIEAAVACPYCLAIVGHRCVTSSGAFAWMPHETRRKAWHEVRVADVAATHEFVLKLRDWLDHHPLVPLETLVKELRGLLDHELIHARDDAVADQGQDNAGQEQRPQD